MSKLETLRKRPGSLQDALRTALNAERAEDFQRTLVARRNNINNNNNNNNDNDNNSNNDNNEPAFSEHKPSTSRTQAFAEHKPRSPNRACRTQDEHDAENNAALGEHNA